MHSKRLLGLLAFISISLCWLKTATATVVEPLDLATLAAESSHVVHGRVGHVYTVPERGPRGEIYTQAEISVVQYIIGDGPSELVVQQLGGQLGEWRMVLSGNAEFRPGAEVVVFLDADPERALHYVSGSLRVYSMWIETVLIQILHETSPVSASISQSLYHVVLSKSNLSLVD